MRNRLLISLGPRTKRPSLPARAAWSALVLASALLAAACSGPPQARSSIETTEREIQVTADARIGKLDYAISSENGFRLEDTVDVAASTRPTFTIGNLPVGGPYSLVVSGTSTDGQVSCSGSTQFSVQPGVTTPTSLRMSCKQRKNTGGVRVDGESNLCPIVATPSALPAEVMVGGKISMVGLARDPDSGPSPLAVAWTAQPGGTFEDPTALITHFRCTRAGTIQLTLTVSDGDPGCSDPQQVEVTCTPATVQTATGSPTLATITTGDGVLKVDGDRDGSGAASAIRAITRSVPGQPSVTVYLDETNQVAAFESAQTLVRFERDVEGKLLARVSAADVETYEVLLSAEGSNSSATAPTANAVLSFAATELSAPAPATSASRKAVQVLVRHCGNLLDSATVALHTRAATGLQTTTIATRVGPGTYSGQIQLPPDGATQSSVSIADACSGFADIADLTCEGLSLMPETLDPLICSKLAVQAGPAAPEVAAVCFAAIEGARLFCMVASPESAPPGSPSLPEFICNQIEAATAPEPPSYPMMVWASARIVGLSTLALSDQYSLSSSAAIFPALEIRTDEGCSTPPPPTGCTYSVQPADVSLAAIGGGATVTVNTASGCAWQAVANAAWVTSSPSSSSGAGTVLLAVTTNPGAARLATVDIGGQLVTVHQAAGIAPPPDIGCSTLTIDPISASYGEQGGAGQIAVHAPSTCAWRATVDASWLAISGSDSGTGDGQINYQVAGNSWPAGRTSVISISGQTHTVTQASPSLTCHYGVDHNSKAFTGEGGSDTVTISANFGLCALLEPKASDPWISIGIPEKTDLLGQWRVTYSVGRNTSTVARTGTIAFMDAVLTIQQAGLADCAYMLDPPVASVPATGGAVSFALTSARADCAWQLGMESAEVRTTGPTSGSGAAVLSFAVGPNTSSSPRSFTFVVAGVSGRIEQAGVPAPSRTLTINVQGSGTVVLNGEGSETCVGPGTCVYTYPTAAQIALTARGPLLGWSQDCSGVASSCFLTMNTDHVATASFTAGTPGLSLDIQGPGAVLLQPAGVILQAGSHTVSVADGTTVRLAAAGQLAAWGGACAGIGVSFCTLTVNGTTRATAQFRFAASTPSVGGTTRTMGFGTMRVGQVNQIVERYNPLGNLRFSFLSQSQRADWIRVTDANPPGELAGFSLPYGSYFTWPAVRNGQNVMFQFSPMTALANQQITVPLYWWIEGSANTTENVIMLTGTGIP